jgi:Na+/proline symporter
MLSSWDYCVIIVYFIFLIGIGWFFHKDSKDSNDYFRGGGLMAWWLTGSSAFMASFSAWTFTGAAGVAYKSGIIILWLYLAGAIGFLVNWKWFGARFRQLRVIVIMEAVRKRFGPKSEQFFTWTWAPMQIVGAGIWLYGLSIFCAPAFGFDLRTMIIICGSVACFVSVVGGSWGVAVNDFFQAILLVPIAIILSIYSLISVGGPTSLLEKMPMENLSLVGPAASGFGVLWIIAVLIERVTGINNLQMAGRYLSAIDGKHARKASLLCAVLFLIGTVTWFIPAFAARAANMDVAGMFPSLTAPEEGAYVAMARIHLPSGLFGLLVTGIISATLSSMDGALNKNAGIMVRSFYLPILRPKASEKELVLAGRVITLFFGIVVLLIALFYTTLKDAGAFKIMFTFTAMAGVPCVLPMFWCLLVRRTPDWAGWSTVLVGLLTSGVITLTPDISSFLGIAEVPWMGAVSAWVGQNLYSATLLGNFITCSVWFLGVAKFCPAPTDTRRVGEIDDFFDSMSRPLALDEKGAPAAAAAQAYKIGIVTLSCGAALLLLLFAPNSSMGRIAVLVCALFAGGIGAVLMLINRRRRNIAPIGRVSD